MALTRIFFTSDVHGSERVFLKFLNSWRFYKANVIILGGDITGKIIIPIVEQSDGTYKAEYLGTEYVLKSGEEVEALEKKIRFSGCYPFRTNPSEMEELRIDKQKFDACFSLLMKETVKRWVKIADERLKNTGVKCFISPGNDDRFEIDSVLDKGEIVVNPEEKAVFLDDHHEMITLAYVNVTPWHAPRDITEEELAKKLENLTLQLKDVRTAIFNLHCPPHGSGLDTALELDKDLKPVAKAGQLQTISAGSIAVLNAIKKQQPLLGLHGHIHESRGICNVGRTLCINPGSEYTEGILRGAIIDLDEKGVKGYLLTSG